MSQQQEAAWLVFADEDRGAEVKLEGLGVLKGYLSAKPTT